MAAAPATLDNYMIAMLLIADAYTRAAILAQGLNDYDNFLTLTEKDITDICANIQKPGGTVANPAFIAGAANVGIPATIPSRGLTIGYVHEKQLKMLRYYILHLQGIQRPFSDATATVMRLTYVYALKETEDNEDDDDIKLIPTKLTTIGKVWVTIENIDNYLARKRGMSGVPLAYVVCTDIALPDPGEDPGFGMPSYAAEMTRGAPHVGTFYQPDNVSVWNVIRHVTHEGPAWAWVQSYLRACDGT